MMSSMADGSIPDRRTTSGSTVVISVSGGVLTSVPLNDRPMAVLAAPTMTGVGMFSTSAFGVSDVTKIADNVLLPVGDRRHSRLRYVEVLVTQPERLLGPVLRPRLDEVELPRRELKVRAERVEQVAGDFLALVGLALLDEAERFLGDDDAVGRHLRGLLRPVPGPGRHRGRVTRLGEGAQMLDGTRLDDVAGQQQPARQHRTQPVEEHVQAAQRWPDEASGRHADL